MRSMSFLATAGASGVSPRYAARMALPRCLKRRGAIGVLFDALDVMSATRRDRVCIALAIQERQFEVRGVLGKEDIKQGRLITPRCAGQVGAQARGVEQRSVERIEVGANR